MADHNDRTLWCGNLSNEVTEEILYELFLQAGPVESVSIPKDPKNGRCRSFGFVTFKHECSVPYAMELMTGETLFKRPLLIQNRSANNTVCGNSPSSHYSVTNSPQTPINRLQLNQMGNGFSPYSPKGPLGAPLLQVQSELIVLDDDCSPQNKRHRSYNDGGGSGNWIKSRSHDDVFLIDNDQPWQNGRQTAQSDYSCGGGSSKRLKDRPSPALRMDSVMRNPWEQLEDGPNTSRHQHHHHHRQHRNWSPYDNRRRY